MARKASAGLKAQGSGLEAPRGDYFKVMVPDRFFARDFEVVQRTERLVRVKNNIETYWVTRARFEASQGTVFRTATVKERHE